MQSNRYKLERTNGMTKVYKLSTKKLFYVVMDKLGMTLQKFLAAFNGPISLQNIVYIGLQIINYLEHLHQKGLIYNNLNGSNIFVGRKMFDRLQGGNFGNMEYDLGDFDSVFLTKFTKA